MKRFARVAGIVLAALTACALVALGLLYMAFIGPPLSSAQQSDRDTLWSVAGAKDWVQSYYVPYTPSADTDYRFPKALVDAARASGHWGNRLPPNLIEAARITGVGRRDALKTIGDPKTPRVTYHPLGGSAYELCASFQAGERFDGLSRFWSHPAGPHCFDFDARKQDLYRPPGFSNAWLKVC